MRRPPVVPVEKKNRIVMSILAGEVSISEAARREKVSAQSIGNWKRQFLEAGRTSLASGSSRPSTREQQLESEVQDLTHALGEAAVEILGAPPTCGGVWKKSAEGQLGPSMTLK